jgi:hypothetical protein
MKLILKKDRRIDVVEAYDTFPPSGGCESSLAWTQPTAQTICGVRIVIEPGSIAARTMQADCCRLPASSSFLHCYACMQMEPILVEVVGLLRRISSAVCLLAPANHPAPCNLSFRVQAILIKHHATTRSRWNASLIASLMVIEPSLYSTFTITSVSSMSTTIPPPS